MRGELELERVAQRVWDDLAVGDEERRIAAVLIHVIAGRRAEIDRNLADVTENWRMERLGAIAPGHRDDVARAITSMFDRFARAGGGLAMGGSQVLSLKGEAVALLRFLTAKD